jgi:peptidoglycan hydrolase-like protein with peptidoglycan-binding domain
MSGSHRCTYSGFPCASDADKTAIEALNTQQIAAPEPDRGAALDGRARDRELTGDEIRELQELLSRAGYRVGRDGLLGGQTQKALASWRRRMGLPGDGTANLNILEELRRSQASSGNQRRRKER